MKYVVGDGVAEWVSRQLGNNTKAEGTPAIGLMIEDRLVAGVIFSDYNKVNIFAHIYLSHPRYARPMLRVGGHYVFVKLGCRRLTLVADEANLPAVRLHQRLGGVEEGRLVGASPTGTDILVFRLTLDSCTVRGLVDGKRRRFSAPAGLREHHPAPGECKYQPVPDRP